MQKLGKPDPTAMASLRGVYYYDNRYHNNYANDTTLYYSLLISKDGTRMGQRYFPHNEAESSYHLLRGNHLVIMIQYCIIAKPLIRWSMN